MSKTFILILPKENSILGKRRIKKVKVFYFIKWSSGSVNQMFIMLQEEPASQQSDCTTFQNALYDSFTFNACAEKIRAIAFCHHAWRDTYFVSKQLLSPAQFS